MTSIPPYVHLIAKIDLSAIQANYRLIKSQVGSARCFPVVKADAYGFGAVRVTQCLMSVGATDFFVADLGEAMILREACPDATIIVLSGVLENTETLFLEHHFIPVLISLEQVKRWQMFAIKENKQLPAILHLDTGISRTGLPAEETNTLLGRPELLNNISLKCVMSHLACADDATHKMNGEQLNAFLKLKTHFPNVPFSLAGSEGIYLDKAFHLDIIRPGKTLYGLDLSLDSRLQNALTLKARILQIKTLPANQSVGYGASFSTHKATKVATLGIGYADGWSRRLSNQGYVLIGEYKAPVIGRISMDLMTIDISDIPETQIKTGSWATLISKDLTAQKVAKLEDTISRELTCQLNTKRCYRMYSNS